MPSQGASRRYIDPELKILFAENSVQNTWKYQYIEASRNWASGQKIMVIALIWHVCSSS